MAQREDPYSMIVRAVDAAGNTKETPNAYTFPVDEGRPLLGAWALADPVGSDQAAGGYDGPDATVGPGVTFGVDGPHGSLRTGAQLDGTSGAYLSAGQRVIDTDKTFAVAAWVMLPEVPTSSMTVISRDGSAQSGFSLGFDGESKRIAVCPPGSCQPSGDPCG